MRERLAGAGRKVDGIAIAATELGKALFGAVSHPRTLFEARNLKQEAVLDQLAKSVLSRVGKVPWSQLEEEVSEYQR